MFIKKNLFFSLLLFSLFLTPLFVFAQTSLSEANIVATINIRNSTVKRGHDPFISFKIYHK